MLKNGLQAKMDEFPLFEYPNGSKCRVFRKEFQLTHGATFCKVKIVLFLSNCSFSFLYIKEKVHFCDCLNN